jgi:hypothetical protein
MCVRVVEKGPGVKMASHNLSLRLDAHEVTLLGDCSDYPLPSELRFWHRVFQLIDPQERTAEMTS